MHHYSSPELSVRDLTSGTSATFEVNVAKAAEVGKSYNFMRCFLLKKFLLARLHNF